MDRWDASRAMFWTALRSGFVYHLALFAFEEIRIFIAWIRCGWNKKHDVLKIEDEKHSTAVGFTTVSTKTIKNAIICVAAMISEALGASLGTLIYPGNGTLIFDRLFANCPYFICFCLLKNLPER